MRKKKSLLMERIEAERGRSIEELIREGVESGCTQEEIAASLSVSLFTLRSWLWRLGARSTVCFPSDDPTAVSR
jgi:DNA-binding transcriptional regulator YiaG